MNKDENNNNNQTTFGTCNYKLFFNKQGFHQMFYYIAF